MKDLIEEIFGDIYDEYDDDDTDIKQIEPNKYLVKGLLSIEEVNDELDLEIPIDDDYDTLAGFILNYIGYIPNDEDKIIVRHANLTFEVITMDEKRIDEIMITIEEPVTEPNENEVEI